MAKSNKQELRTDEEKLRYYSERAADMSLSQRERSWAQMRVKQLTKKLSGSSAKKSAPKKGVTTTVSTAQCCAESAGIGYGAAKAGKRVPIKPENKDAFRSGVRRGRALK